MEDRIEPICNFRYIVKLFIITLTMWLLITLIFFHSTMICRKANCKVIETVRNKQVKPTLTSSKRFGCIIPVLASNALNNVWFKYVCRCFNIWFYVCSCVVCSHFNQQSIVANKFANFRKQQCSIYIASSLFKKHNKKGHKADIKDLNMNGWIMLLSGLFFSLFEMWINNNTFFSYLLHVLVYKIEIR